ncbi:hypothetical protein OR16_41721, partial [Cupriavidus basilensis OR16]
MASIQGVEMKRDPPDLHFAVQRRVRFPLWGAIRRTRVLVGTLALAPALAAAQATPDFHFINANVQKRANGVLSLMSYSVVPDLASSSLSINNASSNNPGIVMSQLGGGATMSKSFPLYLEGAIAYSRYDPEFVATNGTESRSVPTKWNTVSATGGIGWDFPLTENKELVFRPIFNFSLGYVAS